MNSSDQAETTEPSRAQPARMNTVIGYVLAGGVVLSVTLVAAGLAWHWVRTGELGVRYSLPQTNLIEFVITDLRQAASAAVRPRVLVSLGIATLLLTPYVRVLTSLAYFAFVERDGKYSAFTGFVLAVLTYSLFLR